MRLIWIGVSLVVATASTSLAAPKKKPTTAKQPKAPPADRSSPGVNPGDIEMGPTPAPASGDQSTITQPASSTEAATHSLALALNDRKLTIGKGRIDVHAALPIGVVTIPDITGNKTSSTTAGFAVGASVGIDAKAELGADYSVGLHPGDVKGALTLHGAYLGIDKPRYDLAVTGALVVHPIGYTDPISNASSTTTYVALQAGAWFRYRITATFTAFTGLPALPHPNVGLSRSGFAFPPMPYQLTIGLNNSGAIALGLPVGVGFQAAPNIYAFAATNLANIKLSHTSNAFLFSDFIPLTIGGFYSLSKVDLGAMFSDDLRQAADYLSFSIVARYFIR